MLSGEDGKLGSPAARSSDGGRDKTVMVLVIWNVVVTMLLFTVIVALFLVCINNKRWRSRATDRYAAHTPQTSPAVPAARQHRAAKRYAHGNGSSTGSVQQGRF